MVVKQSTLNIAAGVIFLVLAGLTVCAAYAAIRTKAQTGFTD